jgi:integrase
MAGVKEIYKTPNQLRLPHGLTRFAYYTGWRKGKILTLEWRAIHEDVIRLRPEIAQDKGSGVIILVPLGSNLSVV